MKLFHLSIVEHAKGAVLQPGNWGAKLDSSRYWKLQQGRSYRDDVCDEAWRLASEMTLELVRAKEFDSRPSRLNCVFVFEGSASANAGGMFLGARPFRYEVTLADKNANSFETDFGLVSGSSRFDSTRFFLPSNREIAHAYWSGKGKPKVPEILTESPVVIGKRVT